MENDDFSERHDFREEKTFVLVDTTKKKKRAYGRRVASPAWHACVRCTGCIWCIGARYFGWRESV